MTEHEEQHEEQHEKLHEKKHEEQTRKEKAVEEEETPIAEEGEDEPTDIEVVQWEEEYPFPCDFPDCDVGLGGRPFRGITKGRINLHKFNAHGVSSKKKEKGKAPPKVVRKGEEKTKEGEADMVNEAIKRKEAAELKGKLTQTINRIIRLGTKQREVLEPENSVLKEWKRRCLQKECSEEEIIFMQDELTSIVLTIDELEKEAKEEKKKKTTKETKRTEDDEEEGLFGYGDMKTELKTLRVRAAVDEAREDREAARRRRDREEERRDEEHQARMQAMRGGGIFGGMGGGNPQIGTSFIEEVIFKHDEEGNAIIGENGQPIAESIRRTPANALAIHQGQGRGDGGKSSELRALETFYKLTGGDSKDKSEELKILKEQNTSLITEIRNMAEGNRDKQLWGGMSELKKGLDEMAAKIEEDPMEAYIKMQDNLKEHNIYPEGGSSPEVKKIDLEIEREKTRRSMDLLMMNKTFKIAETAITKISEGHVAKAFAKKIDQSDIIKPEEEELPPDDELEAEIEAEVNAELEPEPPLELPPTVKKGGKRGRKKRQGEDHRA